YGICSACHGRDLADWILNHTEGKSLFVTAAGAGWPLFTVVGLVIGSFLAARRNGEFSTLNLGANVRQVAFGAVVVVVAIVVGAIVLGFFATLSGACPLRQHVLAGQGRVGAWSFLAGFYLMAVAYTSWIEPSIGSWVL